MQGDKLKLKMFVTLVCLVLMKMTKVSSLVTSSEANEKETTPCLSCVVSKLIDGFSTMMSDKTNSCFCVKQGICVTKPIFDSLVDNIVNISVKKLLVAVDIVLFGTSLRSLYFGELPFWKMASLAAMFTAAVLPIQYEDHICFAASKIDKSFFCKMYCFWNEEKLLPPPEDPPVNKLSKRLFPGFDVKRPLVSLKAVVDTTVKMCTGLTLNNFCYVCIFALITLLLLQFIIERLEPENCEEIKFTHEELLEEYDDMPEFRHTLDTWLTPRRPAHDEDETESEENHV